MRKGEPHQIANTHFDRRMVAQLAGTDSSPLRFPTPVSVTRFRARSMSVHLRAGRIHSLLGPHSRLTGLCCRCVSPGVEVHLVAQDSGGANQALRRIFEFFALQSGGKCHHAQAGAHVSVGVENRYRDPCCVWIDFATR